MKIKTGILKEVQEILSMPMDASPFQRLRDRVKSLTRIDRVHLVSLIQKALRQSNVIKLEKNRVYLAKLLAALFPMTLQLIKDALTKRDGELAYEMHFSIFCWLDSVQGLERSSKFESNIPKLVGNYLQNVKKETAAAAWMAGDLLGDHWKGKEAGSILLKTVKTAAFPAGRKGAIHGLSHLAENSSKPEQNMILKALTNVLRVDPDSEVRSYAKHTLACINRKAKAL